ncbi:MAG: methionyl-tRNA formyltransferase [Ruminococcaceae bacterium]|nr:methionyl-tRNA formyltransferase [Oscillospiraceae bacterium]
MNIVFMGTPDFAVASLDRLLNDGHNISAVFTKVDMPRGRKMIMTPPEVKVYAESKGLTVYQPHSLKDEDVINTIKSLNPDVIVVVAYGKLLPPAVLEIPKFGCINLHASLLPKYRGAAPIQWTVINGDKVGGATTMYMNEGLDTGDMILTYETKVGENETSGDLFDRLAVDGADLLSRTLVLLEEGRVERTPQDESKATYASMLDKSMCVIDWSKSCEEVHNLVRGLNPWPVALTTLEGKRIKIIETRKSALSGNPGQVISVNPLTIACGEGSVEIITLQPEGKKAMDSKVFLMGHRLDNTNYFGK